MYVQNEECLYLYSFIHSPISEIQSDLISGRMSLKHKSSNMLAQLTEGQYGKNGFTH